MNALDDRQEYVVNANYELFIICITLLSIVNSVLWLFSLEQYARSVIQIIEYLICTILLLDFFFRLIRVRSKSTYFFHNYGWLDLLGSLPVFGIRLARLVRPLILARKIRKDDLSKMSGGIVQQRARSTLLAVLFFAIVIFEISGIAILKAETQSPEANIQTAGDALWWAYVTVATVGYGDRYPVTTDGRIVGILLMTAGVGLFSVLTSYLADWFRRPRRPSSKVRLRAGKPASKNAYTSLDEVQRLLEEYDAQHQQTMAELQARLDEIKNNLNS